MKAVVLNDTRTQFHHGCELVMKRISDELTLRGVTEIVFSQEGSDWFANEEVKKSIETSSIVVVNGEGTIHHGRPHGEKLLSVVDYADKYNVPCYLINATYQSNPTEFSKYLSKFRKIYVRESFSKNELESLGFFSEIVPDLTLSAQFDMGKINRSSEIISATDSAFTSVSEDFYSFAKTRDWNFLPVLRFTRNEGKFSFKEALRYVKCKIFSFKYRAHGLLGGRFDYLKEVNFHINSSMQGYFSAIANSSLVVSGRFHSNCYCLLACTPFLAVKGNSHKVEAMIGDIGLDEKRIVDDLSELMKLSNKELIEFFGYSEHEKELIRNYIASAQKKTDSMFNEIFSDCLSIS